MVDLRRIKSDGDLHSLVPDRDVLEFYPEHGCPGFALYRYIDEQARLVFLANTGGPVVFRVSPGDIKQARTPFDETVVVKGGLKGIIEPLDPISDPNLYVKAIQVLANTPYV